MDNIGNYQKLHQKLMAEWKAQDSGFEYFTEDGIVNPEVWFNLPQNKRIVFLLKEAYIGKGPKLDWNEAKWINGEPCRDSCPHKNICSKRCPVSGKSFNRIAEWTYFLTEQPYISVLPGCTRKNIYDHVYWLGVYNEKHSRNVNNAAYLVKRKELLRRIAIVNLKKTDGHKSSNNTTLKTIAGQDKTSPFLLHQLELIQPHYVVCCGTWDLLSEMQQRELFEKFDVIKVPHPNAHISRKQMLDSIMAHIHTER